MPSKKDERDTVLENELCTVAQKTEMHCANNVIQVMGDTGDGKSTFIAYLLGCELEFVKDEENEWVVIIKKCPDGITPPAIGLTDRSMTAFTTAYFGPNGPLMDTPGSHDNGDAVKKLVSVLATQFGSKTTESIKAVVKTMRYDFFMDKKLTGVEESLGSLSNLFKTQTPQHGESLVLLITHLPYMPEYPDFKIEEKSFFMKKLKTLEKRVTDRLAQFPTDEDKALAETISYLLKTQQVVLFNPLTQVTRDEFFQMVANKAAYPATDLALIGAKTETEDLNLRLQNTYQHAIKAFDVLLNVPQQIETLKEEEVTLKKISEGFTVNTATVEEETTTSAPLSDPLNQAKAIIDKMEKDLQLIDDSIATKDKEQITVQDKMDELDKRTDLATIYTMQFDETKILGELKGTVAYSTGWLWWKEDHERPENELAYNHTETWVGPPLRSVKEVSTIKACYKFGGPHGDLKTDIDYGTGKNNSVVKFTYMSPLRCPGGYKWECQVQFRELPENKITLDRLKMTFHQNQDVLTELRKQHSQKDSVKTQLSQSYADVLLLRATKQNSKVQERQLHIEASTKAKNELLNNQQRQRELKEAHETTLTAVKKEVKVYNAIERFRFILDMRSAVSDAFHEKYEQVLPVIGETIPKGSHVRCVDIASEDTTAKIEEDILNFYRTHMQMFVDPDPTSVMGGAAASLIRSLPVPQSEHLFPQTVLLESRYKGHWNRRLEAYPTTKAPVFHRDYYSREENVGPPVGRLRFYGTSLLCRDEAGTRTNLVEATGVGEPVMGEIQAALAEDPNVIENICEKLPPTESELLKASVMQGAGSGAVRGIANTVGYAMKKYGIKEKTIHLTKELITYGFYFQSRLSAHCETDASSLEACGHAAMETAQFACISKACQLVDYLGQQTAKKEHGKYLGSALSIFSKFAPLAYSAKQDGWTRTTAAVTTSLAVEHWVSQEGENAVNALSR